MTLPLTFVLTLAARAVRVGGDATAVLTRRVVPAGARERGQATAEYALVLLGAAVVAIALITWATSSGRIGQLFDAVFDELQSRM